MFINIIIFAYCAIGFGFQIPSYVHLVVTGDFIPPYGVYLPGLDTQQWTHCLFLFLFNVWPFFTIMFIAAFESFIYIMFNNMFMISKIMTNDIDELGMMVKEKSTTEREIKCKLIAIMQMHIDYNE